MKFDELVWGAGESGSNLRPLSESIFPKFLFNTFPLKYMKKVSDLKDNKIKRCLNCGKILKPDDFDYESSICGKCIIELLNKLMSRPEK